MQSSSSIIKNYNVDFVGNLIVDTEYEYSNNAETNNLYTFPDYDIKDINEVDIKESNDDDILTSEENDIIEEIEANIIKDATEKARQIENNAFIESELVRKEAYDSGYKEGYDKSYDVGYEAGYDEALTAAENNKQQLIHEGERVLYSCKDKYEKYIREHEKEIMKCIVNISEKVLKDELSDTCAISNMIKFELEKISESKTIIIKLNPRHYDEVNSNIEKWKNEFTLDNIFVIAIDDIDYDQVVMEKDNGKVKINLSYALDKIKDELLK